MKHLKKCLLIVGIVAISGYGISRSIEKDTAELNALTLANIEALATGESQTEVCLGWWGPCLKHSKAPYARHTH